MGKFKKQIIGALVAIIALLGGYQLYDSGPLGGLPDQERYVIGTKAIPVENYTYEGTSSSTIAISDYVDVLTLSIQAVTASTTGALRVNVEYSNDANCTTNSSSSTLASTYWQNIDWFDLDPQTSASGNVITLNPALTDSLWAPGANGGGTSIDFIDVNAKCIRYTASSSNMTYYIEQKTKQLNN